MTLSSRDFGHETSDSVISRFPLIFPDFVGLPGAPQIFLILRGQTKIERLHLQNKLFPSRCNLKGFVTKHVKCEFLGRGLDNLKSTLIDDILVVRIGRSDQI